jgi:biopolymer transport protein ExbD
MPYVPLAAMGDIAFLLIIFFMLNATFLKDASVTLQPPTSGDLEQLEDALIAVSVDAEGVVRLQGNQITTKSLETAVERMLADRDDRTVKLSVDRNQAKEVFLPVVEALSRAGATLLFAGEETRIAEEMP